MSRLRVCTQFACRATGFLIANRVRPNAWFLSRLGAAQLRADTRSGPPHLDHGPPMSKQPQPPAANRVEFDVAWTPGELLRHLIRDENLLLVEQDEIDKVGGNSQPSVTSRVTRQAMHETASLLAYFGHYTPGGGRGHRWCQWSMEVAEACLSSLRNSLQVAHRTGLEQHARLVYRSQLTTLTYKWEIPSRNAHILALHIAERALVRTLEAAKIPQDRSDFARIRRLQVSERRKVSQALKCFPPLGDVAWFELLEAIRLEHDHRVYDHEKAQRAPIIPAPSSPERVPPGPTPSGDTKLLPSASPSFQATEIVDGKNTEAFQCGDALARGLGVPPSKIKAFRKRLDRLRVARKLPLSDWKPFDDRDPRAPKFYYRTDSPTIRKLASEYVQAPRN